MAEQKASATPSSQNLDATVVMEDTKPAAAAAAAQAAQAAQATQTAQGAQPAQPAAPDQPAVEVSQAELPEAADSAKGQPVGQLEVLLETAMPVSACLGEVEMEVRELLDLGINSVVRLDRQVGQPIDLMLRGVKFAKGHVVVIGDQIGVRISEILASPDGKPAGK